KNVDSFSNITTIGGDLTIANSSQLVDVAGLSNLKSLSGALTILDNGNLANLSGFSKLTAIGGDVRISNNQLLENLYGLELLELIQGSLQVDSNAVLADCIGLATVLGWPFGFSGVNGDVTIENNAEGCNSVQQILDLAVDTDGDGFLDNQDAFPEDAAAAFDNDSDGDPDDWLSGQSAATSSTGLTLDTDDDNDGVVDALDAFPFDSAETLDIDADGVGDRADLDRDGDGVPNDLDGYPNASTANLADLDRDGRPDVCDFTATTNFAPTPENVVCVAYEADDYHDRNETRMLEDLDADNDGVPDQLDIAPLDPALPEDGATKLYFEATGESVAGAGRNQFFGRYLDMDENGKILVAGGLSKVRVFQRKAEGWAQLGSTLGEDLGGAQYRRVQLGRSGNNVAIGSENFGESTDSGGAGEKSGRVQVYEWVSEDWAALGDPITGASGGALFGSAIAMDKYGLRMAVGAPGEQAEGSGEGSTDELSTKGVGSVTIYEFSGDDQSAPKQWRLNGDSTAGSKLWGVAPGSSFGSAVALSRDASVLAVSAIGQEDGSVNESSVQVYRVSDQGYVQMGAPIQGKTAREFFGRSIALDQLGTTLAVGADGADVNGENSGAVRVYKWDGAAWAQLGSDIGGEAAGDGSGTSVDLNVDGTVLMVGAPGNSGNGLSAGHARVYAWNNTSWVQRGPDIDGAGATDFFGRTVTISGDGLRFAAGADGNDDGGSNAGHVQLFNTSIEGDSNFDTDEDGIVDADDNCPRDANEDQLDGDGDGRGNLCDADDDDDGYLDDSDLFPLDAAEWADNDADGAGDNADEDDDNDGVKDEDDQFPWDPMESVDTDLDGTGNNADTDDDGDGVADSSDVFPLDATETVDTDSDGTGNNADTDDDGDGVADSSDAFPLDATETVDTDSDGAGNNADTDDDGDGVADSSDVFPLDATETIDTDSDGTGNNADTDDDGDGVTDSDDIFPL
ncbi:thrombospondin type 3 repeat-containing protein, partial [Pseudomonadales bacterium]|nr:thrombospondin type 3 repeat-containing protein [Pseudomonadales bacterium]